MGSQLAGSVPAVIYHVTNDEAELVQEGIKNRDFWREVNGCISYDSCTKPVVWCEHSGGHSTPSYWLETAWEVFAR